jgi:uncharacterized protein (TIGR00369 family)
MPHDSHSAPGAVPPGFAPMPLGPADSFIGQIGPLYGQRTEAGLSLGFRVEPRHCNPVGICHGGMLTTLADMIVGAGTSLQGGYQRFLMTVTLACDFLAPAPLGAWVEGRSEVLRTTRTLVFAQCLLTADGTPALRASGILKLGQPFGEFAALMSASG